MATVTLNLPSDALLLAADMAEESGVTVPQLLAGIIRWTATIHGHLVPRPPLPVVPDDPTFKSESVRPHCRTCHGSGFIAAEDEPANCPACTQPTLNPACENLRRETHLWISAVDIGDGPDGVLWAWAIFAPDGTQLQTAIEHDRKNHDKSLLDFLTGYSLGMHHIPF